MPDMSSVKTFVKALKTGMTKTTKALDKVDYEKYLEQLKEPHVLDTLPEWARKALTDEGLVEGELEHINEWPNDQKEQVRIAIVDAVENKKKLQFFWELHGEVNEGTDIKGGGGSADTIITFLSPRAKIKVSPVTFGDITVGVGPPD